MKELICAVTVLAVSTTKVIWEISGNTTPGFRNIGLGMSIEMLRAGMPGKCGT